VLKIKVTGSRMEALLVSGEPLTIHFKGTSHTLNENQVIEQPL
jgi:hypothetical protein